MKGRRKKAVAISNDKGKGDGVMMKSIFGKIRIFTYVLLIVVVTTVLALPVYAKPKGYVKRVSLSRSTIQMTEMDSVKVKATVKASRASANRKITVKSSVPSVATAKIVSKRDFGKRFVYTIKVTGKTPGRTSLKIQTKGKGKNGKKIRKTIAVTVKKIGQSDDSEEEGEKPKPSYSASDMPAYSGEAVVTVNNGIPYFTDAEKKNSKVFENYSDLDSLGRCGTAYALICKDLMPTEERGPIGHIKPTGFVQAKYEGVVDSNPPYLYNRCHLIGFQLAGENDNEKNLITGTRYFNATSMLSYENKVAEYVRKTGNHVLYRITPLFKDNELVCRAVLMEAWSQEDNGAGVCFNVLVYNIQPGVIINYLTGESQLSGQPANTEDTQQAGSIEQKYVLNTNTKKFHYPSCSSVSQMSERNKQEVTATRESIIADGYSPCGNCKP